jgi:hypothetical protein
MKTTPQQLKNARNWYRRKKGIPEEAPLHTRSEPFNRKRRGTGNVERRISMPKKAWDALDEIRGNLTRGEFVQQAIRTEGIISGLV